MTDCMIYGTKLKGNKSFSEKDYYNFLFFIIDNSNSYSRLRKWVIHENSKLKIPSSSEGQEYSKIKFLYKELAKNLAEEGDFANFELLLGKK